MAKKSDDGPKTSTVYEIRNTASGALEGTQTSKSAADREVDRLNKEAHRDGHRHLGRPVGYEVVTNTGVILSGN